VRVKGIVWLGTRTPHFAEMRDFFAALAGKPHTEEGEFAVWDLENGDRLEVFGAGGDAPPYADAPVAGFLVDDVAAARAELETHGAEFIGQVHDYGDGNQWSHFRAPDGHVYELTNRPDHPLRRDAERRGRQAELG
jgi:catechol 2,3-dioxygenase-like lactoylglutathione lyase family enzyme